MIEINIPGSGSLQLEHLVTDVNGTLAVDGQLIEGVAERLEILGDRLTIHMLTADTHAKQISIDRQINLTAVRILAGNESEQKADYVRRLGAESVVALGQGRTTQACSRRQHWEYACSPGKVQRSKRFSPPTCWHLTSIPRWTCLTDLYA